MMYTQEENRCGLLRVVKCQDNIIQQRQHPYQTAAGGEYENTQGILLSNSNISSFDSYCTVMILQDIKETKCYGDTHGQTVGKIPAHKHSLW